MNRTGRATGRSSRASRHGLSLRHRLRPWRWRTVRRSPTPRRSIDLGDLEIRRVAVPSIWTACLRIDTSLRHLNPSKTLSTRRYLGPCLWNSPGNSPLGPSGSTGSAQAHQLVKVGKKLPIQELYHPAMDPPTGGDVRIPSLSLKAGGDPETTTTGEPLPHPSEELGLFTASAPGATVLIRRRGPRQ